MSSEDKAGVIIILGALALLFVLMATVCGLTIWRDVEVARAHASPEAKTEATQR